MGTLSTPPASEGSSAEKNQARSDPPAHSTMSPSTIRSVAVGPSAPVDDIKKCKVLIPGAGNPGSTILGKPKLSEPGTCSSNTYNVIVLGTSVSEAKNLIAYLKTRFVRYLVATRTSTQDMAPKAFEFVPVQEWSHIWTDEELFAEYVLDEAEMADICNSIPEME